MTIIDSQVHAYEANTPKRPWDTVPNWPAHVTGDEMVAAMDQDPKAGGRLRVQCAGPELQSVRSALQGQEAHWET